MGEGELDTEIAACVGIRSFIHPSLSTKLDAPALSPLVMILLKSPLRLGVAEVLRIEFSPVSECTQVQRSSISERISIPVDSGMKR
jgi:hypothetical protein